MLALALAAIALLAGAQTAGAEAGRRLFHGEQALAARLAGHAIDLPRAAVRCINCHGTAGPAAGRAPALSAAHLLQPRARRGGPPSRYDEAAFCRLLQSGLDPANVLIDTTMPRYTLAPADCRALWSHLTQASP